MRGKVLHVRNRNEDRNGMLLHLKAPPGVLWCGRKLFVEFSNRVTVRLTKVRRPYRLSFPQLSNAVFLLLSTNVSVA